VRAAFALFLVAIIAVAGTSAVLILLYNVAVMIRNYFFA